MRERARFAYRETFRVGGVRRYRLRAGDIRVCVRHGVSSWTFEEVFGHRAYDPSPEAARLLADLDEVSIVDLGGHLGYASARLGYVLPRSRVVAYEADPANAALHAETIRMNDGEERWRLVRACASDGDGEVRFVASGTGSSHIADRGEEASASTVRRRDVLPLLQAADFAKLDIEGSEWAIMADDRFGVGGPQVLVLEYHARCAPGSEPRTEAIGLLERAGYRIIDHRYPPRQLDPQQGLLWAAKGGRVAP